MKKYIIVIFISMFFLSCEEWLTIQPETMVTPEDLFKTSNGYKDALIGCYQLMEEAYSYDGTMVTGMIEDMACTWENDKKSVGEILGLHEYKDDKADNQLGMTFKTIYKVIANVSELINHLKDEHGILEKEVHDNYLGQALGLRAFLHFELIRLWGPMPSDVKEGKKYLPYVEHLQIQPYEYLDYASFMFKVEQDLNQAETLLAQPVILNFDNRYINYCAVLALQARFNFWKGENEKAILYGQQLLEPEVLKFFPIANEGAAINYKDLLKKESIWQYSFSSKVSVQLKKYNYSYYVQHDLFENIGSDVRLNFWDLKEAEQNENDDRMLLTKYNVDQEGDEEVESGVPLIRTSEIYLMLMELCDIEKANALYEDFCKARRIPIVHFASKGDLMKRLQLEYRREFVGEGQMFFNYKRWGTVNIPRCKRGCGESAYVPPIPRKEFEIFN